MKEIWSLLEQRKRRIAEEGRIPPIFQSLVSLLGGGCCSEMCGACQADGSAGAWRTSLSPAGSRVTVTGREAGADPLGAKRRSRVRGSCHCAAGADVYSPGEIRFPHSI